MAGYAHSRFAAKVAGTQSAMILEFVLTLGVWELAERLHASAILAVVAFAMTSATHSPARQTARDRVHSESVWESTVFVLNVMAFLLMGLQVRRIVADLPAGGSGRAFAFAGAVLAMVIAVRMSWVSGYAAWARMRAARRQRKAGRSGAPDKDADEGTALESIPTPRVAWWSVGAVCAGW